MDVGKVRTIHYHLGISYVWFLLLQVLAGLLMSLGISSELRTPAGIRVCLPFMPIGTLWGPLIASSWGWPR